MEAVATNFPMISISSSIKRNLVLLCCMTWRVECMGVFFSLEYLHQTICSIKTWKIRNLKPYEKFLIIKRRSFQYFCVYMLYTSACVYARCEDDLEMRNQQGTIEKLSNRKFSFLSFHWVKDVLVRDCSYGCVCVCVANPKLSYLFSSFTPSHSELLLFFAVFLQCYPIHWGRSRWLLKMWQLQWTCFSIFLSLPYPFSSQNSTLCSLSLSVSSGIHVSNFEGKILIF